VSGPAAPTRKPGRQPAPRPHHGRGRLVAFAVIIVLVVGATVGFLIRERSGQQEAIRKAPKLATVDVARLDTKPRIVFRNESRAHYGVLGMVSLADPSGPRGLTSKACARVYSAQRELLCISLNKLTLVYQTQLLGPDLHTGRTLPLAGVPSRARLSADGTLAATTTFTASDSYVSSSFSTRTTISTTAGTKRSIDLESLKLVHRGKRISPVDRNYWGVTFASDDNRFYATVAFSGHTWLVRGDLKAGTVTTMREDAECPSLSPDGTRVVYKKRLGQARGHWRLVVLDLATGRETKLAETRSIDDQAEWLDAKHVLYAVLGSRGDKYLSDVYSVPADGTGRPKLLIPQASSPAVVR
jgi:hypothetical protein